MIKQQTQYQFVDLEKHQTSSNYLKCNSPQRLTKEQQKWVFPYEIWYLGSVGHAVFVKMQARMFVSSRRCFPLMPFCLSCELLNETQTVKTRIYQARFLYWFSPHVRGASPLIVRLLAVMCKHGRFIYLLVATRKNFTVIEHNQVLFDVRA